MGASVSCHARWSSVWSRSGYNIIENDVGGMYNAVYVVKIIVYIDCVNCILHSLFYNVVVMSFVIIFDCCSRVAVWSPFLVRSCGCTDTLALATGTRVGASDHAIALFVLDMVVSLDFCILIH